MIYLTYALIGLAGIAAFVVALVILFFLYWFFLRLIYPAFERADEFHYVPTRDGWQIKLFRYKPRIESPGEPVLLCHGAFANHHNFDIPKNGSLADFLAEAGLDCWLMDYRGDRSVKPAPKQKRNNATVDQYLLEDIPSAVTYIKQQTGYEKVHAVGHSMGGMLLYAYDLTFEDADMASLSTLGSPVGFEPLAHKRMPRLLWMIRRFPRTSARVQRMLCQFVSLFHVSNAAFPVNWSNMPKGLGAHDFFHAVDLLPWQVAGALDRWAGTNEWHMCNGELDVVASLPYLATPLLAIYAEKDLFTPPEYVQAFFDSIKEKDKQIHILSVERGHEADYNHIDLAMGPHARQEVFAPILEWIEMHAMSPGTMAAAKAHIETPEGVVHRPTPADLYLDDEEETEVDQVAVAKPAVKAKEDVDEKEVIIAEQRKRLGRVMGEIQAAMDDVSGPGQALPATAASDSKASAKSRGKAAANKKSAVKKKTPTKKKAAAKKAPAKKKPTSKKKASAKKAAAKKPTAKKAPAQKKATTKKKAAAKKKATSKKKASAKKASAKKGKAS